MSFLFKPLIFLAIIAIGYLFTRRGIFRPGDVRVVTNIVMTVSLPGTIVHAFSGFAPTGSVLVLTAAGFAFALVPILLVWTLSRHLPDERRILAIFCTSGFNIGCFGMPVVLASYGSQGAVTAMVFDIGNALLMTGGSYAIVTALMQRAHSQTSQIEPLSYKLRRLFSSVPFCTYCLMLAVTALAIPVPAVVEAVTAPIASANTFLAMLMLGMMFVAPSNLAELALAARILALRLAACALCALAAWYLLPVARQTREILCVLCFAPVSALAPFFTYKCRADGGAAAFVGSVSVIVSLVAMTAVTAFFGGAA